MPHAFLAFFSPIFLTLRRSAVRIGTLGAGMIAEALARPWARAGHEIIVARQSSKRKLFR